MGERCELRKSVSAWSKKKEKKRRGKENGASLGPTPHSVKEVPQKHNDTLTHMGLSPPLPTQTKPFLDSGPWAPAPGPRLLSGHMTVSLKRGGTGLSIALIDPYVHAKILITRLTQCNIANINYVFLSTNSAKKTRSIHSTVNQTVRSSQSVSL